MRPTLAIVLLALGGCTLANPPSPPPQPKAELAPHLRSCPALPAVKRVRTIEAVLADEKRREAAYRECAERHRLTVDAFDRATAPTP